MERVATFPRIGFFCQRALDLGYKVFADTRVVLKHCGDCVYPIEDPFTPRADTASLS